MTRDELEDWRREELVESAMDWDLIQDAYGPDDGPEPAGDTTEAQLARQLAGQLAALGVVCAPGGEDEDEP